MSGRVIEAIEEQLYTWALFNATGTGGCSTSPIYALMAGKVQNPRCGAVALVDDTRALEVDRAMAAVKRESPQQYQVLKAEAFALLDGDSLASQRGRARHAQMSVATYCRHLQRARLFLAALLFGPRWVQTAGELYA